MRAAFFALMAVIGLLSNCTRGDNATQLIENSADAKDQLSSVITEMKKANLDSRSPKFKSLFKQLVDTLESTTKTNNDAGEAVLRSSNLYLKMAETGETSLAENKAIISSLFANRHALAPEKATWIQEHTQHLLQRMKEKHPSDAELYLLSFYGMELATENDVADAKALLRRCIELDPNQKRCREFLDRL